MSGKIYDMRGYSHVKLLKDVCNIEELLRIDSPLEHVRHFFDRAIIQGESMPRYRSILSSSAKKNARNGRQRDLGHSAFLR